MPRVRGMHGQRLDAAIERVETVVVRVLRGIASRVAWLVGTLPSPAALSDDDLQVIRRDWRDEVTTVILPAVRDAYVESAETLAKDFADAGRPVDLVSLEAPSTSDFLDAATNRLVGVADTLWETARRELADGVRAGEGIEELAARLQEAGGFGLARARTIARTEVVAASNAASLAQALRLGDASMVKEWMDADDERVREAHEFADGQRVPIGDSFEVGGEFLQYPGQPIGRADNVINERCTLGYSWDDQPITAAAEVHTGAMVALRPSAADAERLAVDGGEPADQLHVTLFYLGEAGDYDEDGRAALINAIRSMVERREIPALIANGFGLSVFNPDGDEPCWVLDVGDPPDAGDGRLGVIRGEVEEAWHDGGVPVDLPEQHTPWRPHLTLVYDDDLGWAEKLTDRVGPVTFDSIWVAFGGENTDIPLAPVEPSVAAAEPAGEPEHLAGVDLADSGIQVDSWGDNSYSFADPTGAGFWLTEDEANGLIDALNAVRSGEPAATVDVGASGIEVASGDGDTVQFVPQDAAEGWSLTDSDAYDLSYWLAFWLQTSGYYKRHEEALAEEVALTSAQRPWDPGKHPRGPDGRFIRKGLVPPKGGDATAKSRATPRTEAPTRTPQRGAMEPSTSLPAGSPGTGPDGAPQPADDAAGLAQLKVPELRQRARDLGLTPGRARKADLIAMLTAPPASRDASGDADPAAGRRAELTRLKLPDLRAQARELGVTPGRTRKAELVDLIVAAERDRPDSADDAQAVSNPPGIPAPEPAVEPQADRPRDSTEPAAPVEATQTAIRDAIAGLQATPGAYVKIADVRDALGDQFTRAEVDAALDDMFLDEDIAMLPEANQKTLAPRDREAAVNIGAQDQHLIRFIPPRGSVPALVEEPTAPSAPRQEMVPEEPATSPEVQPAASTTPTPVDGAPVSGARLNQPLIENLWGATLRGDAPVAFHDDGEIGRAINAMGDDALLDVDGRPLGDVLGMLATDAVTGRSTSQEVLDKLKTLQDRLPEGGRARRALRFAIAALDAPDTAVPEVPDGTPEPVRQLVADLHAVPLVRRDPSREEQPLADLLEQIASGRLRGRRLVEALRRLRNLRHESFEGKAEIDRAIDRAIAALSPTPTRSPGASFASQASAADFAGSDASLRNHWIRGEGAAKIRWGTPGDFDRCVRQLADHVRDPEGLCARYHHEAVGKWPGEKGSHGSLADEGLPLNEIEVLPDGPVVETMPVAFEPGEHWHAVGNIEDVSTGLRVFLSGALSWREPPFAFHWQWKSSAHGGTPETVHVGLVTRSERDALGQVHMWGVLDLEDEFGLRYARRLARRTERWVSIGLDESFKEYDIEYEYATPAGITDLDGLDADDLEVEVMRIGRGRIAELTGVSVPAQAEAVIEPSPLLLEEFHSLIAAGYEEREHPRGHGGRWVRKTDGAPGIATTVPTGTGGIAVDANDDGTVGIRAGLQGVGDQPGQADIAVNPGLGAELATVLRGGLVDGGHVDVSDDDASIAVERIGDDLLVDVGANTPARLNASEAVAVADALDEATALNSPDGEMEPVSEIQVGDMDLVAYDDGSIDVSIPDAGDGFGLTYADAPEIADALERLDAAPTQDRPFRTSAAGLDFRIDEVGDVDVEWGAEVARSGTALDGAYLLDLAEALRDLHSELVETLGDPAVTAATTGRREVARRRITRPTEAPITAAGDAVDVAPAEDGAVTLTLVVDDQTHVATATPEAAAELAAALRTPPADGEAVDIDGGALNLSRDGDDFYLDLGPEAAILGEADLPALADAIDAALGVEPKLAEDVIEEVGPPAMATRPAVLQVGGRSLAARVVGPTVEVPGVEVVVASGATEVHTITIPNVPPADWFAEPTDVTPQGALTITDEGRVFGYLAPAGVAHRSFRNRRVEVPMGNVDYARWMGGEAIVAGGGRVVAGPITFECGHCDPAGPRDSGKRMEHYDNTCSVAAKAAIGENQHGVWIAGALEPGVSAEQVSRMLACRLSGDWAPHPEKAGMREFVAALLVPVPGFAMGRRAASTVRVQEGALVAAAVPVQLVVAETTPAAEPSAAPNLSPALDRVAKGIGRDRVSRMDALHKRVHAAD